MVALLLGNIFASPALAASSGRGVPCGNSYISPDKVCRIGTPGATPTSIPAPRQAVWFANCQAAFAAGRSNIPMSDGAYSGHLDRDHDGIACESNGHDADNYNFNPYNVGPLNPNSTLSAGNAGAVQVSYGVTSPVSPDPLKLKVYRVIRVEDSGDLVLNADYTDFPARLIGVKIPEAQRPPAVAWLRQMLPVNSMVYVQQDKVLMAQGGVLWVYLWQDQQLTNTQLVLAGLAMTDEAGPNVAYLAFFQAAQATAKAMGTGSWRP